MVHHAIALDQDDPARRSEPTHPGVDASSRVSLSDNADLDVDRGSQRGGHRGLRDPRRTHAIPFWPLLFANVTLRLLGSDDFPAEAKQRAARDLTTAAAAHAWTVNVGIDTRWNTSPRPTNTSMLAAKAAFWSPSPSSLSR